MQIETPRLILRSWEFTDISSIVDGLNNLNVAKWMGSVPFPYTEADAEKYITACKSADEKVRMSFAIVLKETNQVIGGTEIRDINYKDGTAGGGIWLNETFQKNGYGTEAFSYRNKYCFEVLGLRRIENGYFAGNEKSHKMQLKLGYKDEGVRRKKFFCMATGEIVDECVTGLLKEEFVEFVPKS